VRLKARELLSGWSEEEEEEEVLSGDLMSKRGVFGSLPRKRGDDLIRVEASLKEYFTQTLSD